MFRRNGEQADSDESFARCYGGSFGAAHTGDAKGLRRCRSRRNVVVVDIDGRRRRRVEDNKDYDDNDDNDTNDCRRRSRRRTSGRCGSHRARQAESH